MPLSLRKIFVHILGILAFLSIPIFTSPDINAGRDMLFIAPFLRNFVSYFLLLIFFYANYYHFIPNWYFKKRYLIYIATILACYAFIIYVPEFFYGGTMLQPNAVFRGHANPPGMIPLDGRSPIQFLLVLSLSFLLRINKQLLETRNDKLRAEVSYLKAQINPHFLFNTLNSLYALTIEKSDLAPDAVIKLSNMMRYVVTESAAEFVPLEKEISYIRDYVDMQRLRIPDEPNLEFIVSGNFKAKKIAPLVIIPFIENAFKYGINPDENWHIVIAITVTENDFILDVRNKIVKVSIADNSEQGIENTAKRLEIIYPGSHELEVYETKEMFIVTLKINFE